MTRGRLTSGRATVWFAAGAITAIALTTGGVALAAIPSSSTGTFTACVARNGGAVRIIDPAAGQHCRAAEKRVSWSQGWSYRGGWSAGATYRVGSVVLEGTSSYVATRTSHGLRPSVSPQRWGLLAAGATGSTGTGGTGALPTIRYVSGASANAPAGHFGTGYAFCPEHYSVVSGSADWPMVLSARAPEVAMTQRAVDSDIDADTLADNGWRVDAMNAETTGDFGFTPRAVCMKTS